MKETGRVCVLSHGTPGSRLVWRRTKYFKKPGIRIITAGRDGYGNSVLGKAGNPEGTVLGDVHAVECLMDFFGDRGVQGTRGERRWALRTSSCSVVPKE
ncbi:hypothetical protein K458DRAFT_423431 [Lentithecium fluviatile CBS 122367]|uniref:Uncharacterized protein n=1 Tax=Lentithecium fluviatile CBS 122367 TaxID=1168545 RepID=A0A6G1IIF0_9PLEO|nr:hypothetical protein K458DRAFT_423431 [Lentithecium fluviatile CBS 122367]